MKKLILATVFVLLIFPAITLAALININTADATELDKIPEVGPAIAGKIIAYRTANGPFKTIEEIKNVSGIGDATFLKMKDFITVGSGESPIGDIATTTGGGGDTKILSTNGEGGSSGDYSVHTNNTGLSNYKDETLKIGAGRERLATVRTPIMFSASQNKNGENDKFIWSFGDGTSALGSKVYRTFQFPGQYNVILNGSVGGKEEAVARTIVVVTEVNLKITEVDLKNGFVEITNNSDKEQNLNNWSLRMGTGSYTFPLDTILSSRAAIKVPLKVVGLTDQNAKEITLTYPDGGVASQLNLQNDLVSLRVIELKKQLAIIKRQIAEKELVIPEAGPSTPRDFVSGMGTTSAGNVVVLTKEPNWFEKIKHAIFE